MTSRRFLVCLHDATPAYSRETEIIIRDLRRLVGRTLSVGVVPNWHGEWPLAAYPDYCRLVSENFEEILLHGYFHQRRRGCGPTTFFSARNDEMNGLSVDDTLRTVECGQRVFAEVFGAHARGFLAPAWQRGHVRPVDGATTGLEYVLGFFSLESCSGRKVPLATRTWDCGRWAWLGHVGHGVGALLQSVAGGVPTVAVHPRDLKRGFWPAIRQLIDQLLKSGYEPATPASVAAGFGRPGSGRLEPAVTDAESTV